MFLAPYNWKCIIQWVVRISKIKLNHFFQVSSLYIAQTPLKLKLLLLFFALIWTPNLIISYIVYRTQEINDVVIMLYQYTTVKPKLYRADMWQRNYDVFTGYCGASFNCLGQFNTWLVIRLYLREGSRAYQLSMAELQIRDMQVFEIEIASSVFLSYFSWCVVWALEASYSMLSLTLS